MLRDALDGTKARGLVAFALALLALALTVFVSSPAWAYADETEVEVPVVEVGAVDLEAGRSISYGGIKHDTTVKSAAGNTAYCIDPSTPLSPGTYEDLKTSLATEDLNVAMWFSYGAPGFDESIWTGSSEKYYDGTSYSAWSDDSYYVMSHLLLSYVSQGRDWDVVLYGTNDNFQDWAKTCIQSAYKKIVDRADEVSTGFQAFVIDTGEGNQECAGFVWECGDVEISKVDAETGVSAQGDASLEGATFEIVNASGRNAFVDGVSYPDGEVVKTIKTEWDEDAQAYVAKTEGQALPVGRYLIREASASEGYLVNLGYSQYFAIEKDGQVVKLYETSDPVQEEVIRGGVQVTKADAELGTSEALAGDLSGIEFTITNASEGNVVVNGVEYEPGQAVMTITTAWDEEAQAYVARTAADALPYGTYEIQETKTNGAYLLTDGEARTFQIREDGVIVTADASGEALTFYNQVKRNDVKLQKKANDTNEPLQVAFAITNKATGETHVLVTDVNGNASTASSWNAHSNNTNGNDHLLEMAAAGETITADDMDPEAGIWFGLGEFGTVASASDDLSALPLGEYTLTELPCEANEGYELITLDFSIYRDSNGSESTIVWLTLDDQESPRIGTQASDAADGDQIVQAGEQVTIVDTVQYENLEVGKTYTITGTLMVKSTGLPLLDADGNAVTASKEFVAITSSGTVDLEFTFDASLLAGEDIVAFESLATDGVEVAAHADINDENQTVRVVDIHTTATDAADGDKFVEGSTVVIADEVAFEGLTPGETYTLEATLMDATTGLPVQTGTGSVSASVTFTPETSDGTQVVELTFDASELGGRNLVVFERLLDASGRVLAVHEDLADEGQTVTVEEEEPGIGTTLVDGIEGDKVVEGEKVTLIDRVSYYGLTPGDVYTLTGTLMVKSTGLPLLDASGNPVTSVMVFTAPKASGTVDMVFTFDASLLAGEEIVAFESLTQGGIEVAAHADINDKGQTVTVEDEKPEIGTTLVDAEDGDHTISPSGWVTLVDTVTYKGLTPGETYTVTGTLMVKSTGLPLLDADGNPVTATTEFVAEASEGTVEVTFEFDASGLEDGTALVAFEQLLDAEGTVIATHEDLDDEDQTVTVETEDEGDDDGGDDGEDENGGGGDTQTPSGSGGNTSLPETGDASPYQMVALAGAGVVASGIGLVLKRRTSC